MSLRKHKIVEQIPTKFVKVPGSIIGEFAEDVLKILEQYRRVFADNNPYLRLELRGGVLVGSNTFVVHLINQIFETEGVGARTLELKDLSDPRVLGLARERCRIDARGLVLRSEKDRRNSNNNPLAKILRDYVPGEKLPLLLTGLELNYDPKVKGFGGLTFVPGKDFGVFPDDRFSGRYDGWKFTNVDDSGIPINLDRKRGTRT